MSSIKSKYAPKKGCLEIRQQLLFPCVDRMFLSIEKDTTGCYICCGTGNTPESITDYKLDSFVELELVNGSVGFSVSKILSINTTFKNNTNSSITIKEIGLYSRPATSTSVHSKILIYRKVLDTPVTIAPDEIYTFTITLN